MDKAIRGKVWKLGDDIDTDIIIPTQFLALKTITEMKKYAFHPLRPELPGLIQKGDIIVAGKNFGCGSSREQAPEILMALGISCVIAKSYARIFYRNALNNGLLLIESDLGPDCREGDFITVDPEQNLISVAGRLVSFPAIPPDLLSMIEIGGLIPFMRARNRQDKS